MMDARTKAALRRIVDELAAAEKKHPCWPGDVIYAVAIMIEEAGESMQAAIDYTFEGGGRDQLKTELAQTGAMCLRALMHL